MNFEVGQIWETRGGKWIMISHKLNDMKYPIRGTDKIWRSGKGKMYNSLPRFEHSNDLIKLVGKIHLKQ